MAVPLHRNPRNQQPRKMINVTMRTMKKTTMRSLMAVCAAFCLSACSGEGILGNIYDEADAGDTFVEGFHHGLAESSWTLQLDATGYDEWIYIDLHSKTLQRIPVPRELTGEWDGRSGMTYHLVEGGSFTELSRMYTDAQAEPDSWDFAIHHFDVKTNGGKVSVAGTDNPVADEWTDNQVIVDTSGMMGYRIGYQNSFVNLYNPKQ